MPDAAEAAAAGAHVRLQHLRDPLAQPQIGVADDAGADAGRAVAAAGAHGGDAVDELGLPTGRSASGPSARCIDQHCRKTVATMLWPLFEIGQQLVEQVGVSQPGKSQRW